MQERHVQRTSLFLFPLSLIPLLIGFILSLGLLTAQPALAAAPATPTNLTATMASSSQINLVWQDKATTEVNYYVERSPNGSSSWTVIATLGANVQSYQSTSLTQNTTYYYRVRCKAGTTYSSYSNKANARTATLAAPTGLTASVVSAVSISLGWTDTAYETQYFIERSPNGTSSWVVLGTVASNVTTTTNSGLSAGTTYYYRARAYDSTNYSAYSNTVNAKTSSGSGFTITASASANGSISPSGAVSVNTGSTASFTMTPNTGYLFTSLLVDGATVTVISPYVFNNVTANHTISATFTDKTPPTGSISINNNAAYTNNLTVTLTLGATDNGSGVSQMQFSNDNIVWSTAETYTTSKSWLLTAGNGTKTVYAKFKDTAGNWSGAFSYTIYLDTVAPTVTITAPVALMNYSRTPLLSYIVNDGNVTVKVDGVAVQKTSGAMLDPLVDGIHTVRVEATDSSGNVGFAEVNFKVDAIPPSDHGFLSVAAGKYNTYAIKLDGTLWYWGSQLVDSSTYTQTPPAQLGTDSTWALVSAGDTHTAAIKQDGTLWTWGNNGNGELGDGTYTNYSDKLSPIKIDAATNWVSVATGGHHTIALKSDGTLWAWGYNYYGQLGDGTTYNRNSPVQIGLATDWTSISTGSNHTVALKTDGTLWTWGYNYFVQLGDGTIYSRATPSKRGSDTNWSRIAAGTFLTLALKSNGTLWAWGYNGYGQYGNGATPNGNAYPVQVGADIDWKSIVAGERHVMALKSNGTLWTWGTNAYGQLGDGTTTARDVPAKIGADNNWSAIAAGGYHSVANKSDGVLWAWGNNAEGELGDGTLVNEFSPVQVSSHAVNINDDATYTNSALVTLKFKVYDKSGVAEMQLSSDNVNWSAPEPYILTKNWTLDPVQGIKTVYAKFKDTVGNWSDVFNSSINLLYSYPTGTMEITSVAISSNSINTTALESSSIFFTIDRPADVTLKIIPEQLGSLGAPIYQASQVCPGQGAYLFTWDGKDNSGNAVTDGAYIYVLQAIDGYKTALYSPSAPTGTGSITCSQGAGYDAYRNIPLAINYGISQPARVDLSIDLGINMTGSVFKIMDSVAHVAGAYSYEWDGRKPDGTVLSAEATAKCVVVSLLGENVIVTSGNTPKVSRLRTDPYGIQFSYGEITKISYTLSRDASVTITLMSPTGSSIVIMNNQAQSGGDHSIPWDGIDASDPTGKRIVTSAEGDYMVSIRVVNPVSGASSAASGCLRIQR